MSGRSALAQVPAFDPPLGTPPTIEWIALTALSIDESYQRSINTVPSQRLIDRIAKKWDWRMLQPLSCSRRDDGGIVVIDGQHRYVAASRRGDIPHLPCTVSRYGSIADEALIFAAMNRNRNPMTRLEMYRAAWAGGDKDAVAAFDVIAAAGLTVAPHTNSATWKPGQLACVGGVVKIIKQWGARTATDALIAVAEAYDGEVLQYIGSLLPAVANIYGRPPADFDPDRFIAALGTRMQEEWRADATSYGQIGGGEFTKRLQAVMLRAYAAERVGLAA